MNSAGPAFASPQSVAQPQYAQPQYAQPQYAQPQYAQPQPYAQQPSAPSYPGAAPASPTRNPLGAKGAGLGGEESGGSDGEGAGLYPRPYTAPKVPLYQNPWVRLALVCAALAFFAIGLGIGLTTTTTASPTGTVYSATAVINNGSIVGTAMFSQPSGGPVTLTLSISGIVVNPGEPHGFHIHTASDLGNSCLNTLAHFNPAGTLHGAPSNIAGKVSAGSFGVQGRGGA